MSVRVLAAAVTIVAFCLATPAYARGSLNVLAYSQQNGKGNASAGTGVNYTGHTPTAGGRSPVVNGPPGGAAPTGTAGGGAPSPYPTLSSSSPLYRNPHPVGAGSFWYTTAEGQQCIYTPASNGACFNVEGPAAPAEGAPPVNPAALAEAAASRLALGAGRIQASPSAHTAGLTGAASWFWLEPSPAAQSLSVSLRGERVTVSASAASVRWSFGDGSDLSGGPGVPYRPGASPSGAVRHVYDTRCLPGDRGHDPNVLASCGSDGYTVEAAVGWAISYTASGPVAGGGALPARSTATSTTYPVSEARAFLSAGGGG